MALTPVARSFQQIRNEMMNVVVAETGINDTNVGSAIRSIVESAAMSDFKSQSSIIAVLNSQDIDRATGSDLDKIGKAAGVDRPQAKSSSGLVTIGSSSFTKISTKVYAGTAAPPAGSNTINISDGSRFPNTGSIYIGRGTSNLEGPIPYSSVSQVGNYFQLTLSSPTTKNHNISESVILAQGGNRVVSAGAVVQTKANDTNPSVKFTVINNVTVPDGEESVSGVPVAATQPGTVGNVAANSVVEFASTSFPAAFVTNPTAFISGRDQLSDRDYRDLIKKSAQNKTKGTPQAIESASIGVISTDDNKTVTSAKVRPSPNREEPAILFLDDGTAYQPLIFGQGFEPVVDNAAGSEKFLQLQHEDITRATLISTFSTPFALTADMTLAVKVGGVLSEHIFQSTDFATQLAADTFEVVNSINQNTSLLFSARALANSQRVAIFAKSFKNEDVKVVPPSIGTNANDFIGLSTNLTYSLRLYKNDELLYKDGVIPTALSIEQADWNAIAFVNGATLQFAVDGTPTQTVTFLDADFVPFGYTTVSAGNSLESFVSIINSKAAGLTATVLGNQIKVVSNKDNNDSASLEVVGGTLVTSGNMFDAAFSQGQSSDYALNRATGQVELSNVLSAGDILTAGSRNTRGFVDSGSFSTNAVSFVTTVNDPTPKLYFVVDAPAERVSAGVTTGSGITVTNPSSTNWVYTSSVGSAFTNVLPGDWALIVSKNIPDSSNNKGFWRVTASTASSFTVQKVAGTATAYVAASNDDIIFIRSDAGIQQVNLGTGTQTLGAVAANITSALVGGFAIVQSAKKVRVFTNTFASSGSMFMAGMNDPAKVLEFTVASFDLSDVSHTAFVESDNSELTIPDFLHDYVTANNSVLPPPVIDRTLTTNATLSTYIPPNRVLSFLDAYSRVCNNEDLYSMIASISGTTVVIRGNNRMRDIITNDRYFTASSFNFSGEDNLVVIIDKDAVNKSLNIQMYRNGTVSSQTPPTLSTFTAYDTDLSVTGNWPQSFGDNFDFEDFKVLFKSRQILDPSGANNAMLLRHVKYGSTGDQYRVGLFYPVTPSSGMSHTISVGELTKVKVALASDVSKVGSWAAGSQFNVTNPVGNTYRYSHNGTGPAPNFTTALPSPIVPGDIVTVSSSSPFSIGNEGTFRVTAVTSLYFEVTNASGVVESNIQLNNVNDFLFYALDATFNTANAIAEYVNSNMPDHLFVSQLESGVGVATTSTFEDTASEYVSLVDGENWLSSSNIGTTSTPLNQFVLKVPRQLADSVSPPYSIVGEMFRVVPTMADHVSRFLNRFAVTGLSSLANLNTSSRAGKVQVYSNLFGSNGAVQVGGGTANKIDAAAQSSGNIVDTTFTKFNINTSDSLGIMAGQWVKVTNTNVQAKSVVFGSSSQLQITPNSPTTGFSQVDIANTSYSIVALTGAVRLSNVVTITTTTPHSFSVDQTVTIASVTNASFNGTFLVTSTPTTTTFTYSQVAANATSGGGTATGPFGLGTFQVPRSHSGDATTEVRFERQAQFVCLSWTGTGTAPNFLGGGVREGDWVVVGGSSIDVLNQGTFKVVKLFGSNTLYIENNNAVKENVVLSASSDLRFYSYDSVMPGDEFVVSGDALGSSNNGSFTVVSSTSPSIPFPTPNTIYVVGIMTAFGPASLGTGASEVKVNEDVPLTLYKRIANVAVDPNDPADFNVVVETTELGAKINTDAGSFISLVSRLDFNTMVNVGEDSYKFYGGLIHATGVVIRGSQSDPITYPGVAATGSYIEIDAALPKRIRLSIVIRNITGTPFTVLKTRVQNVVSAYVNSLGVNQSVVFSQIVSVANSVDGVQAVAISSPLYDATHDLITVQPNEKPVIVDVNADIIVSLPT